MFKDARCFVPNAFELALDPLGCTRGLSTPVSSARVLYDGVEAADVRPSKSGRAEIEPWATRGII